MSVVVINLWPHESECSVCGAPLVGCKQGIPMYEGEPVSVAWQGEWAGYDACRDCFDDYNKVQHDPALMVEWFWMKRTNPTLFFNPS